MLCGFGAAAFLGMCCGDIKWSIKCNIIMLALICVIRGREAGGFGGFRFSYEVANGRLNQTEDCIID